MSKDKAKRPVGRPTKYNDALQAKAEYYLMRGFGEQGDAVPSLAGLCCYLGVVRSTVYLWSETYPQFSDTLLAINEKQETMLISGGLRGEMNPTITKLMLANHGYSDKVEQSHTSPDGSMSPQKVEFFIVDTEGEKEDGDITH